MPPRPIQNPPNPWHSAEVEYLGEPPPARLQVYHDASRSIVSRNESPDLGFEFSVNPYRGCTHACAYCYARPTHQYLDFGAGTDFDRKITVKLDAPALLRKTLASPKWGGDLLVFSGVTDCYQPLEATYRLTRQCLEVCREFRNPVSIITKSPLIERDIDVLASLAEVTEVSIAVSIPLWDPSTARAIEPFVAPPRRRIAIVEALSRAGLDVTVNVAPFVPALSEEDMPEILRAAAEAGATRACSMSLRLPGPVAEVFETRLREALPLKADRVLARIREGRGGRLNDPRFGHRMQGTGPYAETARRLFEATAARYGLRSGTASTAIREALDRAPPSRPRTGQLGLFDPDEA